MQAAAQCSNELRLADEGSGVGVVEWWSSGVVEWWSGGVVGVVGLGLGVGSSGRRVESRDATRGGYCDATRGGYCDATRGVSTLLLVESRLGYS